MLEGPILLSIDRVKSKDIAKPLEKLLSNAVQKNTLANDPSTTVMLLSGIHGGEDGVSGLTEKGLYINKRLREGGSRL